MSRSGPVLDFLPLPDMQPFGTDRSVYALEIVGRPLYEHFVEGLRETTGNSPLTLCLSDPLLWADARARDRLGQLGTVVAEHPADAVEADIAPSTTFPGPSGEELRFELPWDLLPITASLVGRLEPQVSPEAHVEEGVEIVGAVTIERGARVLAGARLKGPVYVGADTFVGNNASIRAGASVGKGSVVGAAADIKSSLIGSGAGIGTLCFVGDSVFDEKVWIAGVARTSNTRLDHGTIRVLVGDSMVDTGRQSLGVFVGSKVAIGSKVLILPGRKVGARSLIGPHVIVDKNIPPGKRVVLRQAWDISDVASSV